MPVFLLSMLAISQAKIDKLDDYDRVAITGYVSDQVEHIPISARNNLNAKLNQIISSNGFGSSGLSQHSRFILTPNVVVSNKNVVPSAPPRVAVSLDVIFFVGDGFSGTKFGSTSVSVKGVGSNENKAYISAFNQIKANNPNIVELIKLSKTKILEYYNNECDFILREAETAANQNNMDEALAILTSIPRVNEQCFNKARDLILPVYQKKINRDCSQLLNAAQNAWNSGQNYNAAVDAASYLGRIEPEADCYNDANKLTKNIGKRMKDLDDREWDFMLKEQQDDVDLQESAIRASRDIGVAYGNNQSENMTYNVRGWW